MHSFIKNNEFVVEANAQSWVKPVAAAIPAKPEIPNEEEAKKAFGIELARSNRPFDAANLVFPENVRIALWVSQNWLSDPIVNAAKDLYGETLKLNKPILDKEQLADRVLQEANDLPEGKDRIAALKLYSEIAGYTGKVSIDASTKNYTHNEMTVKLVRAEEKSSQTIENSPIEEINEENNALPIKLKLVKAS